MRLFLSGLGLLLTLSSIIPTNSASLTEDSAEQVECPNLLCANPSYTEDSPCPSCMKSGCNFRGCVHFGAFGASWKPDNCTTCTCNYVSNKEECFHQTCSDLECYGYPMVRKPGKCCHECDFGIAENECGVIPVGVEQLDTAVTGCQQQVIKHGCDKMFIVSEDGEWYKCVAIEGKREVDLNMADSRCKSEVSKMAYRDTVTCEKERIINYWQYPLDYDPKPNSCVLYV